MKVRKVSITNKLIIGVVVLFLISDFVLGMVAYKRSYDMLLDQIKQDTESIASAVACRLDGSIIASVQPGEEDTDEYLAVSNELTDIYNASGVEYIYTVRKSESGSLEYAIDAQYEDASMIGDEFEDDEVFPALSGQVVSSSEPYTDDWGTHLTGYSPIYSDGKVVAALGVDVSMEKIKAETSMLLKTILLLCLIVLAIGAVILVLLCRSLSRKFNQLNDKIVDLTKGDGDLTKKIEIASGDEFEVIGTNVNKLIEFIRGILMAINSESGKLNTASAGIADNVRGAKGDAESISETMTDMSATMQETSASINEINGLMTDITSSFDGIVDEIKNGREFAAEVNESATKIGNNAKEEQGVAETKISAMAESVSDKIERSKAVSRIEDLTGNIIAISNQTNLLALNASIEAARAGDAGKGFAVVATEIGELASNSQSAATEIQTVSAEVVGAVNELASEAQKMLQFVNETTIGGFKDLVNMSEEYIQSAERISDLMEHFSEASGHIQDNIDRIKESTDAVNLAMENAAEGVSRTAERTIEMSNNMSRIDKEVLESNNISNELKTEVGKFKLE